MRRAHPLPLAALLAALAGCSSAGGERAFPARFHLGAASAAHQVEGGNTNNNWYQFETLPRFKGKTRDRSGRAADSWNRYEEDARLAAALGLTHYRFSIEWSRVEPRRGTWSEAALRRYDAMIAALVRRGVRPVITLHHFTDPIWVYDLSKLDACDRPGHTPTDANLCGWGNRAVADAWVRFVRMIAARYGDRVDHWVTINEPMAYISAGWIFGAFPPGKLASDIKKVVVPILRNMIDAHARAYDAIHAADRRDADGDGRAARVGFSQSVAWYVPARPGRAGDVEAARQGEYVMNFLFADALVKGGLDADLDGRIEEPHAAWKGRLDFVGLQYYYRSPTVKMALFKPLLFLPCLEQIDRFLGAGTARRLGCPAIDPRARTLMGYEHAPRGLYEVGRRFAARYPRLPLIVTENGIATRSDRRRSQSLVRHLLEVHRLLDEGVDLRGFYYWSLIDNFEWAEGYSMPFGIHRVDFRTFRRTPTAAAAVYRAIIRARGVPPDLEGRYATGPLAPEPPAPKP